MVSSIKSSSTQIMYIYNLGHNILRLFDILPNFPFTTSERILIISIKYGIHELHLELLNALRLRILGNWEISRRSLNFIELQPSAERFSQNENSVNNSKKMLKNRNLTFHVKALFHTTTKFCLIYFGKDCLQKQHFASNSTKTPSNLICFTILVTLRPLTQNQSKEFLKKVIKFVLIDNYFSYLFTEVQIWY